MHRFSVLLLREYTFSIDVSSAFKFSATDRSPMYILLIILITMVMIYDYGRVSGRRSLLNVDKRMIQDSVRNARPVLGPFSTLGWCQIAPATSMRRFTRLNASILRQKSDALALSLGTSQKQTNTASNCCNGRAKLFESPLDECRPFFKCIV